LVINIEPMFCVVLVVHDKKKFGKHCSRLSKELSPPSNMLNINATQTMHNHVVEEIHRRHRKVYTYSKIS